MTTALALALAQTALANALVSLDKKPLLFMDPSTDIKDAWGLITTIPNSVSASASLRAPNERYQDGATPVAAFPLLTGDGYEVTTLQHVKSDQTWDCATTICVA